MSNRTTQQTSHFRPIRTALVPILPVGDMAAVVDAAKAMAQRVLLVGLVCIPPGDSISSAADTARHVRTLMRDLSRDGQVVHEARVIVASETLKELTPYLREKRPDLLILGIDEHLDYMGLTAEEVMTAPPCDIAVVRGRFPARLERVLLPLRGGPYAELVLRVGLSVHADKVVALHLHPVEAFRNSDAPFRGLAQVLRNLTEIETRWIVAEHPTQVMLDYAYSYDLVVMGATNNPLKTATSFGATADRILAESRTPVVIVRSRRQMPRSAVEDFVGIDAISILVDKWFAENTFHADEFADLKELAAIKLKRRLTVSLALPALNEETTVGKVISTVKKALMDDVPLLDEIVLIDSNSSDRTREIAADLGVPVYIHQELLPDYGIRRGKGEALWKSLLVTRGDIVAWIDTDIVNIHPRFVYGIVGPLILNSHIHFVKGFYRRPLRVGEKMQAGGGGRVTELTARPLLNLFYPELSGIIQPLSGEYASRRKALEQCTFYSGYGVETALLIEIFERFGLSALAQVDLKERIHHNQPLDALSKMSFAILQVVVRKLEQRRNTPLLEDVNTTMKLVRHDRHGYFLDVEEIQELERPPMSTIPEYVRRKTEQTR